MFVRIVWKGDGDQSPSHVMDELIESDHVQISQPMNDEKNVFVNVMVGGKYKNFHLPKDGTEVYFMNDRGQTFDSYRWPKQG
jgi:hypothetical protein